MTYEYLLDIALILISTKLLGLLTKKLHMPQVVGALIAGLLLGPSVLNLIQKTDLLTQLSEIGVIIIMFTAGLETDIKELKHAGKSGFVIAMCGVLVPLLLGFVLAYTLLDHSDPQAVLKSVFIGIILTATSVSITVSTLKELGKLNTHVGSSILAAALIDDVLGIIALTIVTSFADSNTSASAIWIVLLKVVLFCVFTVAFGYGAYRFFCWLEKRSPSDLHRYPILAFVLCLLMSFLAEYFFGVADITGAFAAGVVLSNTPKAKYVTSKFDTISYLFLSPIFFANIGLGVQISGFTGKIVLFSVLLVIVAIGAKIIGCGLGAKTVGFKGIECLQIGCGMACRGEVALIVANKGAAMGIMPENLMAPVVIMVVCCAVFTPILLKLCFRGKNASVRLTESALVEGYQQKEMLDYAQDALLNIEAQRRKRELEKEKEKKE